MDRQDTRAILNKLTARFRRAAPTPHTIYGRRAVPAPGFSLAEIAEAGLSEIAARSLGLPVDSERKSSLGANVESLRAFLKE